MSRSTELVGDKELHTAFSDILREDCALTEDKILKRPNPYDYPDQNEHRKSLYRDSVTRQRIDDLGVDITVTYPIPPSSFHNDFYEFFWKRYLYWKARGVEMGKNQIFDEVAHVLCRQLSIYRSNLKYTPSTHSNYFAKSQDFWDTVGFLKGNDQRSIPFLVSQTVGAILLYGADVNIDPRVFRDKVIKFEDREMFERYGISREAVDKAWKEPAILAGSAIYQFYGDDDAIVYMRQVKAGPYSGRYTLGGGKADWIADIPALREAYEEKMINPFSFRRAKPLGAVDQVLPTSQGNALRYLNLVWNIELGYIDRLSLRNEEGMGPWQEIESLYIKKMAEGGRLTPIARTAFSLDETFSIT